MKTTENKTHDPLAALRSNGGLGCFYNGKEREMSDTAKCTICGEPMPAGEEMFKYHGLSVDCPKPPLPKPKAKQKIEGLVWAIAMRGTRTVKMMFDTTEQANAFVAGIEADDPPNVELRRCAHCTQTGELNMDESLNDNKSAGAPSALNVGLGWISVEDRLPEYDINVFVVMPSGISVGMRWYDQDGWMWSVADYIGGDLASAECLCDDDYSSISHWMPIMELPNAEIRG